AESAGEDVQM
ncbi:putative proteasome subunit alpha type 1, partial [Toxoplasma gondii VAND]